MSDASPATTRSYGAEAFVGVTATAGDFLYGGVLSAGSNDDGTLHLQVASRFCPPALAGGMDF